MSTTSKSRRILSVILTIIMVASLGCTAFADGSSDGVVKLTAEAKIHPVYHQIDAVFVEYSENVVAPDVDGFSIKDYFVSHAKEVFERRDFTEAPITAVYTNSEPSVRADKTSVEGRYIVIEIAPTDHCIDENGQMKPNHSAGMCTWRLEGESCEWLRNDFSEFVVTQNVDVKDADGNVVAKAGNLPAIATEDVVTPELANYENKIIEDFDGKGNSIVYTLYLPDDYDENKTYPLVFNSPGTGGRLNYQQQDENGNFMCIGASVTRDSVCHDFANYKEDCIIVSIQTWMNCPEEWGYSDTDAGLYLVHYMIDNYPIDTNRIYSIGSSYGTFLLAKMIMQEPDLFTAYIQSNGCVRGTDGFLTIYESPESGPVCYSGVTFDEVIKELSATKKADLTAELELVKPIVDAELPIWIWHATCDETIALAYGLSVYELLVDAYEDAGYTHSEIASLVKLNIVEDEEMFSMGIPKRHRLSPFVSQQEEVLDWIFSLSK